MDTTIASFLVGLAVLIGGGFSVAVLRRKRPAPVSPAPPPAGAAVHTAEAKAEASLVTAARTEREKMEAEVEKISRIPDANERRKALADFARSTGQSTPRVPLNASKGPH